MPSATATSYEEEFLSERVLTFSHSNDFGGGGSTFSGLNAFGFPLSSQKTFSAEKEIDAVSNNNSIKSDCVTCNSPIHNTSSPSNGFNVALAPSQFFSTNNNSKISNGMISSAFTTPNPGSKIIDDFHSLQNSPFFNHYPHPVKRQNETNGMMMQQNSNGSDCSSLLMQRRAPQRELFPTITNGWTNNQSTGLVMQDRLYYNAIAQRKGFIVGQELEHIKDNSRRSTSHTYGRISAHFRNRYGETEAKTKASYLQLGVRVPTKDHVSEIVGKGGQKIKLIREETGALITTPGEHEDHVFIIEAPPEIALSVADLISTRALEITQSKANASERRRGSTSSIPGCMSLFSVNGTSSGSNGGRLITRSPDDLPNVTIPSPSPLLKSPINSLTNNSVSITTNHSTDSGFSFPPNCNGNGLPVNNGVSTTNGSSGGRILLARSKISVPQDMVGKIIGTQGSIITTIQKDTGTEIKSPPKEAARGPSATSEFEISAYQSLGMTTSQAAECRVQQAKQLIGHLVMRQFERRYSEDLDDNTGSASSGKSRTNSNGDDSEEGKYTNGNGNGNPKTIAWMWPDVQQMDSKEAQDVLDRILAESKSKTRRVKELQAAAASSNGVGAAGSLPASPCGIVSSGNSGFGSEFFPSDKSAGSCQNSPFHQPRIPSHANVFSPSATAQGSVTLLSGFLPERRIANIDFHSESEYPDNNHVGMCSNSIFWSNPGPRHSFSAGAPLLVGDNSSPSLLRRHTMASAEPHGPHNHRSPHPLLDDSVEKQSVNETDYNIMQALGNLGLEGDESSSDHPPGFVSHFNVKNSSSSSSSIWPSFFESLSSERESNKPDLTRSIWSNVPIQALPENLTQSVIPATKSLSSSSSGSVNLTSNRCGAIGEGRRRTSPSSNGSAAPTEAA